MLWSSRAAKIFERWSMKREIGSQLALPPDNYPILLEELSHEWNSHFLRKRPIYSKLAELQWEQKYRSWIKIAQMTMCEGDAMTWRVEMHSKFYVRALPLPLEKRSLITHLLREMWKHHLHVSDLCSLVFFLNLWNEKLLRDQRNSVNVTLMCVLHPLVSNLSIVKK